MSDLGSLVVSLEANFAKFQSDMEQVANLTKSAMDKVSGAAEFAGKALAALGVAATVEKFAGLVEGAITAQAELMRLSERTGTAVETLSGLKGVAKLSQTSMDEVAGGVQKLSKAMVEAQGGTGKAADAFKAIGISGKELAANMDDPGKMMQLVAQRMGEFKDGAGKNAEAMALMGKAGANLLPMMKDLANAGELNAKLTTAQAEEAKKYEQIMIQWDSRWKGLYGTIATQILPVLNDFWGSMLKGGGIAKIFTDQVKVWADDGSIRKWAQAAADGIKLLMTAIVPAAEIAAAWFAVFVAAPPVFAMLGTALTAMSGFMLEGTAATIGLNTALFGTSMAANTAAGGLFTLQTAASVLFAAFAGWKVGSYLRDNFVEARVAGDVFIGTMLTGWENLKYGGQMAWEAIKYAFDSVIVQIGAGFGRALTDIAAGFAKVGAKETAADIAKYADGLKKAADNQKSFAETTAGLTAEHKKTLDAIDANIVGDIQYQLSQDALSKTVKGASDEHAKATKTLKLHGEAAAEATKAIEAFIKSIVEERDKLELGETQMKLNKASVLGLSTAQMDHVKALLTEIATYKEGMREAELRITQRKSESDAIKAYFEAQDAGYHKAVQGSNDALAAAQREYDQHDLTKSQIAEITLLTLQDTQAKYDNGSAGYVATQQQIDAQQKLIDLLKKGEERTAFENIWHSVDQVAQDTFVNIFKNGKDAFSKLRDTLKDTLLKTLYEMTVQKWVFNIVASITGSMASGAASAAGSSIMGSAAGSAGSSLFGAGALGGMASDFGAGMSAVTSGAMGIGESFTTGLGYLASGAGSAAASIGMMVPAIGAVVAGLYILSSLLDSGPEQHTTFTLGSSRNAMTGSTDTGRNQSNGNYVGGEGVNTAFGSVGITDQFWIDTIAQQNKPATDAFLASLAKSDAAINSLLTSDQHAAVVSALNNTSITAQTGAEGSDPSKTYPQMFADRIGTIMNAIEPGLASLVKDFKGSGDQLQAEVTTLLTIHKNIDQASQTFGQSVSLQGLSTAFDSIKQSGETTGAVIIRMGQEFTVTNDLAKMFGISTEQAFGAIGTASAAARDAMIQAAGGIDAFKAQTNSFFQNFYTDQEQHQFAVDAASKQLNDTFGKLGIAIPASTADYRTLLSTLLSTSDPAYQSVMAVSGAFTTVHGTANDAAKAASDLAATQAKEIQDAAAAQAAIDAAAKQHADAIASERNSLQDQLDQLTMTSTQLLDKQRNAYDASNQGLFDQIQTAQSAKDAATALAAAQAQQAQASKTLSDYITANFVSNAQKTIDAQKLLDSTLGAVGTSAKISYDAFVALLPTLGLSAEDGLKLAQAFVTVNGSVNQTVVAVANLTTAMQSQQAVYAAQAASMATNYSNGITNAQKAVDDMMMAVGNAFSNSNFDVIASNKIAALEKMIADNANNMGSELIVGDAQKAMDGIKAQLAEFVTLEAQYPTHGKALLDLETSYLASKAALAGSGDTVLLALDQKYQADRLAILQGGTSAATAAAAAVVDPIKLAGDRLNLLAQIYTLTGNALGSEQVIAQQRMYALATLDPSLRSLQTELWGLQDAAAKAAKAQADAAKVQADMVAAAKASTDAMAALVAQMDKVAAFKTSIGGSIQSIQSVMGGFDPIAAARSQVQAAQIGMNNSVGVDQQLAAGTKLQSAIMARYQAETTAANNLHQAQVAAGQAAVAAFNQVNQALKGIGDYAKSLLIGNMSVLSPEQQLAEAKNQYQTMLAGAQGGDLKSLSGLQNAANAYLTQERSYYATSGTNVGDFTKVQSDLAKLGAQAGPDQVYQENTAAWQSQLLDIQNHAMSDLSGLSKVTDQWQSQLQSKLQDQAIIYTQIGLSTSQIADNTKNLDVRIAALITKALADKTAADIAIAKAASGANDAALSNQNTVLAGLPAQIASAQAAVTRR